MTDFFNKPVLIYDGAYGTSLQKALVEFKASCPEELTLIAPQSVEDIHAQFIQAGVDMITANTFGANELTLGEHGLAERAEEINHRAVQSVRLAAESLGREVLVAGTCGPGSKLPTLGQIDPDEMLNIYRRQVGWLVEAGADVILFETCQDILQVRLGLVAAREAMEAVGKTIPVMASLTIEQNGAMLSGADIRTAIASLSGFELLSLGLNCATGPDGVLPHLQVLSEEWPGRISCHPNAGLPEIINGQAHYPLSPEDFAAAMKQMVETLGVSLVGGCCGTTPAHIHAMAQAVRGLEPGTRNISPVARLASGYQAVNLHQEPRPLMIGERANANGSKAFRELLLAEDFEGCLGVLSQQERGGAAHALDVCVAYAGRNEQQDMNTLVSAAARQVRLPLVIDSTHSNVVESALKRYPGRVIVNSINLEDGGEKLKNLCQLAKKYNAALVALTIDESGMAKTAADKLAVAKRIYDLAVNEYGLRPEDLLFDPLTFSVGAGDETLRTAAIETLEAIRLIKSELPGVLTVLGVSNISFGLSPQGRRVLNSVFLTKAIEAGLDAAIIHASKVLPFSKIPEPQQQAAMNLLYNRPAEDGSDPLLAYIDLFSEKTEGEHDDAERAEAPPEFQLYEKVLNGENAGVEDLLAILLESHKPADIINDILLPAMQTVGDQFAEGRTLLPFVLQSAEVMRKTVDQLSEVLGTEKTEHRESIILATVTGDVHDIGKNLVDILLSNNGYHVHNLGVKIDTPVIIEKALELKPSAIGLSGLLVSSAIVMEQMMPQFAEAGLECPVLLGGAALTSGFVSEHCDPAYSSGEVVYCPDAFAGLKTMQKITKGESLVIPVLPKNAASIAEEPSQAAEALPIFETPDPPFKGPRELRDIDIDVLRERMNLQSLFRVRWGYLRKGSTQEEYEQLIQEEAVPHLESLWNQCLSEQLLQPSIAYGYFDCHVDENSLNILRDKNVIATLDFPRQSHAPHRCLTDYFKAENGEENILPCFAATIGSALPAAVQKLYQDGRYRDYLLLHGLGVELTETLAGWIHERIRNELGVTGGARFGIGYSACPDLSQQAAILDILQAENMGLSLSETFQLQPELSTTAIVAAHPQARWFVVD